MPAKKQPQKKQPAKNTVAKKAVAKKPVAQKTQAKKIQTKKIQTKKPVAKKKTTNTTAKQFVNEMRTSLGKFTNTQSKALKIQEQVIDDIKQFSKQCSQGLQACIESVQELASFDSSINMNHLRENMHDAFCKIESMDQMQQLANQVANGFRFCELIGVDDCSLHIFHKAAKRLLETKRFKEAEAAFCFLTFMDGSRYSYWLGLGHASFHLKRFAKASTAYHMAAVTDPSNFWPHMYMANCFEALKKFQQAQIALEEAVRVFDDRAQGDELMQETLSQRLVAVKRQ